MALQSNGLGCSNIYNHFGAASDYLGPTTGLLERPLFLQNPANRGTTDLQAASDLGFADAGTVELPDLAGLFSNSHGPAEMLSL